MTSFLLVSTRPEDEAIAAEHRSFLKATGLAEHELEQVRLDMLGLPDIDVRAYDGIIVAGSPYGTTTPDAFKTPTQKRAEGELRRILGEIVEAGTPCLTTGYGTEVATLLMGGRVTTKWAEEPQLTEILLTQEGAEDPLLEGFPRSFLTYVNHHEATEDVPEGAVVLGKSITCPVQIMRLAPDFYATQFNPELDSDAIRQALERWEDAGYPGTDDIDYLVIIGREGEAHHQAGRVAANFVARYRK
ncbi:glutamine amidotransferase-related protein [Actinomyces culturomici]|uniref:glutamine amidotransferase-related protein n=1 Tax=Actinomyces culturomici TaxID=1926276 RepID=UPI000E201EB2|nr:glutamine amidotransferase [Actinomyces culturomici]